MLKNGLVPKAQGKEEEWLAERMQRHLNPTGPIEFERRDGRWDWIKEEKTQDGGIILSAVDVTDRKLAEEALRELAIPKPSPPDSRHGQSACPNRDRNRTAPGRCSPPWRGRWRSCRKRSG